jgi:hypothetical protein
VADDKNVDILIRAKNLTGEAFAAVSAAMKELEKQTDSTTKKSGGFAGAISDFFQKPIDLSKGALVAVGAVGAGLLAVGAGIVALGSHGADVADVQAHFDGLNTAIGNNAKTMLGTLAQATGHTISNFDLMKSANLAMADGVRLTEQQFGTLGRAARVLADQTGGDTKEAFDTLLDAMESGKTKALKSIGVTIDQTQALTNYAAAHHKLAADLNETEKREASQAAILQALEGRLKQTGDAQDDFADAVARGKTSVTNFTDDLSVAIANSPVFAAALGGAQQAMDAAFGGNSQGLITSVVHLLEQGAITLTDFLQAGLTVAGGLGRAFFAVKVVFDLVAEAVLDLAQHAVDAVGGVLELGTHIPKVGDSFKGAAASAKDLSTQLGGMKASFHEQATDAAEGVAGNSAYQRTLDGVSKGVQVVRDAMVNASKTQAEATNTTKAATVAAGDHAGATNADADAMKRAAEEAKKHADAVRDLAKAMNGATAAEGIRVFNEALKQTGLSIHQLPIDILDKLNKSIEAGIDIYRRRGEAAPRALEVERLAIRAALIEAQRAEEEFKKLHGPTQFLTTGGVDLSKGVPTAKMFGGNAFESADWQTQSTLVGRSLTNIFEQGATAIDADKVRKAAQKRVTDALGPGFWKGTFGSPAALGSELSSSIHGRAPGRR